MKNIGTLLGAVALIGVLYLAFFNKKSNTLKTEDATGEAVLSSPDRGVRMAYVRADSLQKQYKYYIELSEELRSDEEKIMRDMERKQRDLQIEFNLYQQEAPKMTPQQRERSEGDLMRIEQQYRAYEQQIKESLMMKQRDLQTQMKNDMDSVLVVMKDELKLDFILLYDEASSIIYASEDFNITDVVVEKLNANYDKKKSETKVEKKK